MFIAKLVSRKIKLFLYLTLAAYRCLPYTEIFMKLVYCIALHSLLKFYFIVVVQRDIWSIIIKRNVFNSENIFYLSFGLHVSRARLLTISIKCCLFFLIFILNLSVFDLSELTQKI